MIKNLKYMNIEYTENDLKYIDYLCNEIENKSEELNNQIDNNEECLKKS